MAETEMEKAANKFDLDLFRLLSAAQDFYLSGPRELRHKWRYIAEHLHHARPLVRGMMSDKDRADTR